MWEHNTQINTMQQPIIMNACMNRKNETFMRILMQETQKTELWIQRYGFGRFGGKRGLFRSFWGYLRNFWVAESFGAKEHGLLRSLEIFQGFFVDFLGVWRG
jgi:hypothetical protein